MNLLNFKKLKNKFQSFNDSEKILLGSLMTENVKQKNEIKSLHEVEFKVFSQWGDDGIIQYLISKIEIPNKVFVEFGVETYHESNTRFLLMKDNWTGLVIDGSEKNIASIKQQDIFWRHGLKATASFITKENINSIITDAEIEGEIGILSVDIDGNDYWITETINAINPIILINEYNSVFGKDRAITVPYSRSFTRNAAHYSNLYYGASLKALIHWQISKAMLLWDAIAMAIILILLGEIN